MRARFLPAVVFFALAGLFTWRLVLVGRGEAPDFIPSAMIGKPAPSFDLAVLQQEGTRFRSGDLHGKVTLLNFFASWCAACQGEHALLGAIAENGVVLAGMNYKDDPAKAVAWLARLGNPYRLVAQDRDGRTGIDFGVYGVPESYLIDRRGVIRLKQTGPWTPEDIETRLLPLVKELNR